MSDADELTKSFMNLNIETDDFDLSRQFNKLTFDNTLDEKCNDLWDNMNKTKGILCLEKLLRYLNLAKVSFDKKAISDYRILTTFDDLEAHLRENNYDKIHDFLEKYSPAVQQKFEALESVFRLFCSKNLIQIFDNGIDILSHEDTKISTNNFGSGAVTMNDGMESIKGTTKLKDSGDISDLTFVNKNTSTIYISTCKNFKDYSGKGKKFDLDKIHSTFHNYYSEEFELKTIVVVRNIDEVLNSMKNMSFSSNVSKKLLNDSYFIDFDDLNKGYRLFKDGNNDPIHIRYFKYLKLKDTDIFLKDKDGNARFFKGWYPEDENNCKLANQDFYYAKIIEKDGMKEIIKRFSRNEIVNYYKKFSSIHRLPIEYTQDYKTFIFGKTVIVDEEKNIQNQICKDNLYNRLNTFNILNNGKEDLSILVIINNTETSSNIGKHRFLRINDVENINLQDYNVLIINKNANSRIIKKFLQYNSNKSFNFICTS